MRSQERFRFDTDLNPRLITPENWEGEELPDRKFWTVTFGGHCSDEPYGLGLAHQLYWLVYFKRNGMKSWLKFLDRFGHPLPLVKYGANATDDEKQQALDIALSLAEDSAAAAPEGLVFELVETARSGTADYTQLVALLDAAISKVILSQTMTTDGGSSRSQAEVHGSVADAVIKSDADLICESFNRTVVTWVTELNFPGASPPRLSRKTEQDADLKTVADRDKVLFDMGYPPNADYIVETFGEGFRPPEKGEDSVIPLNGAQVTALTSTISQAINDSWIPELAVATIRASFPAINQELITAIAEQLQAQADKTAERSRPQEAIVSPEQAAAQFSELVQEEPIDEARFWLLQNLDRAVDAMVLKSSEIRSKQSVDFAIADRAEKLLTADFAAKKTPKGKKDCNKGKLCKNTCIAKTKTCLSDLNPAQLAAHKAAQKSAKTSKGGGGGAVPAAAVVVTPTPAPTLVPPPIAAIPAPTPVPVPTPIGKDPNGIPLNDPYDKSLSTFNGLGVERSYAGVDQTAGNSRLFMARDIIKNGSQNDIDTFMKDQYLYHFEGVKDDGSAFSNRANYEFRTLWGKTSPSVRQDLADEFKGKNPLFKKLSADDLAAAKVAKDKAAKAEEAAYLAKKAAAKKSSKTDDLDDLDDLLGDVKPTAKPIAKGDAPDAVKETIAAKADAAKPIATENPKGKHTDIPLDPNNGKGALPNNSPTVQYFDKFADKETTGRDIYDGIRSFTGPNYKKIREYEKTGSSYIKPGSKEYKELKQKFEEGGSDFYFGFERSPKGFKQYLHYNKTQYEPIEKASKSLNTYLDKAPRYNGGIHRGLTFNNKADFDQFLAKINEKSGIDLNAMSSFSSVKSVAKEFDGGEFGVMMSVKKNKSGVTVKNASVYPKESEVLVKKGTTYKILGEPRMTKDSKGNTIVEIDLQEG